jgi:hypothetical protein
MDTNNLKIPKKPLKKYKLAPYVKPLHQSTPNK